MPTTLILVAKNGSTIVNIAIDSGNFTVPVPGDFMDLGESRERVKVLERLFRLVDGGSSMAIEVTLDI